MVMEQEPGGTPARDGPLFGGDEQYRLLMECVTDYAIFFLGPEGRVASWNAGAERLLGWPESEVLGKHFSIFFTEQERDSGEPDRDLRLAAEQGRADDDRWLVCRNGSRLWASGVTTALRDEHGGLRGFAKVTRDRTAQRRAEEAVGASERRFRALVENAWDGVTLLGPDGTLLETTPITFRGLGYTPEEYVGRNGFELLHPDDVAPVGALLGQLLGQPASKVTTRYRLRHKDGSWRWVEATAANLLDDPSVAAIVINHRDVTEQKRLEDELRLRADQLADADRRKDEFLAMLAHELRNPLAPIRNATLLLERIVPAGPELSAAREIIDRQARHLSRLVDDLLDISRVTTDKITIHPETVDAAAVVTRAVETVRHLIEERRHELAISLPEAPLLLWGDPTRLVQVVGNLLGNAAKYMDEGGHIVLSLAQEQGEVVFRAHDRGMGIPAEMLSRVFDPFVQLDRGLNRAQGGLGIGLALVRSLVDLHGGTVEAFSEGPGKGSEFVVRLPLLKQVGRQQTEQGRASSHDSSGDHPPSSFSKRRVLVVDDNVDSAESLALLLRASGHQVCTAHDGPAALEVARLHRPEVVVLDLGLPRMDGYEVALRLRAEHPREVVLIALTGYGQEEDRRRTREAGFDHHLVKPADPALLRGLLAGSG